MAVARALKGAIVFVTLCVIAAGSGYVYLRHQLGKIDRLSIPGLDESGDVMNVLLVGSDSREDVTGDLAETTGKGQVSGQRSDTMMVLHVDPENSKAAIFSIPRDLYLPISGTDYSDRVNTAFAVAGAPGLIATIEESLGFPINHYVEIDFTGFRDIVNAVGGVKVYFPSPVRDDVAGLGIDDPGCVKLDGDAGLAFVRSRNFETYESGEWQIDPTADLGRIQRQQDFIRRMLRKAVSSGLSNPITLNRLVGIGVRDVKLDDQMTTGDIVRLARRFKSLDADTVDMLTFPTEPADIGGASVLLLKEEEAQPYIDRLNGIGPPEDAAAGASRPSDIRVRILNGYGADGVAGEAAVDLTAVGFNVADRGDADSYNYSATVIRYAPGAEVAADVLNQFVDGGAVIEEDSSLRTVDVTLVLGADYTGIVTQSPDVDTGPTDTTATRGRSRPVGTPEGRRRRPLVLDGPGPPGTPGPPRPSIHAPRVTGDDDPDDGRSEDDRFDEWSDAGNGEQTRTYPAIGERSAGPPRPQSKVPRAVVLKQRRRRRRFIIGLTFFLSVTVTLMGTGYVYLQYRIGQIPRVDVPSLVGDDPDGVMNVLLVGSDSRAGLEGATALQAGTISGQRSDTIMVLHIDQKQKQAAILSIPRDLYVPIAGEDYSDRVNAAFALGGPQGLSATIQEALGITINHYVEVDFVGFKDIVDAVGGVQLYLPAWVRDFSSGLDLPQIGCVNVDGTQGLAWVRSREFEYLVDGVWIPDPRADLGRIERQQEFIRRMLKKALSSGLTNPLQLNRLIGIGVRDVTLDETLSTKDIATLARRFNNLDPDRVALWTLPTTPADIDGKSVLELREEEAKPYLDRINGRGAPGPIVPVETTTTLPAELLLTPADVDLRVLNGEGTPGAAARAAAALETAGFTVAGTDDATEISRTTVRYGADAEDAAQLLDQALVGGANLVLDETVTSTDVVLVLGADYQGLKPGPVAPVPRVSTTSTTSTTSMTAVGGTVTTVGDDTDTTTSTIVTTTVPPAAMGPPTLPPGVEC